MPTTKILGATPRPTPARPGVPAWLPASLILLAVVALLGLASGAQRAPADFAAPEPQRVLEDWRGNSAGPERLAE